ncbi:hypothetical protein BTZ20_3261 [Rhodococcus sp. MTM3W5.2]|nr:hypothetical protein BTZ20_3261 [Rhodococcus sp. MTM3W5.2]
MAALIGLVGAALGHTGTHAGKAAALGGKYGIVCAHPSSLP